MSGKRKRRYDHSVESFRPALESADLTLLYWIAGMLRLFAEQIIALCEQLDS